MKTILCACIGCLLIAPAAHSDLTDQDLKEIRLIIHEANEPIKTEITTVKNEVSWIRGRIEGIEKQITHMATLVYALIALVVAAVAIPQIIMTWRSRNDRTLEKKIEELVRQNAEMAADIETLKKQRILNP